AVGGGVLLEIARLADEWSRETGLPRGDEEARLLGERYLDAHPGERDAAKLLASLGGALDREALARAVREDARAGRTVQVEGWILSLTEARLYGLAALAVG